MGHKKTIDPNRLSEIRKRIEEYLDRPKARLKFIPGEPVKPKCCRHGHPRTIANTYWRKNEWGKTVPNCRICGLVAHKKRYWLRKYGMTYEQIVKNAIHDTK